MIHKNDNDYQVTLKLVRREVANAIAAADPKAPKSSADFVSNYSFGSGGSSGGGFGGSGDTTTSMRGFVYDGTGVQSEKVRSRLIGQGVVYLVDDETNDQICIRVSALADPMFYIGF